MKECKWKQRITIYGFVLCLVGVMVLMVISPKETVSRAERRRLAEKPRLTAKGLLDKSFMDDTEKSFRQSVRRTAHLRTWRSLRD